MSTATATATKWECARCGVSVRQADGAKTERPANWAETPDGDHCLTCRRERAAEVAVESTPEDASPKERSGLRRAALLEFEVTRTPDKTDGEIARACRTSVPAVADARQRLGL